MSRQYDIIREEVDAAWKAVRRAGGGAGFDGQRVEDVEKDLDNQLYKIWNRMSSGSLQAQPVLLVNIPKAKGGVRQLGIPTVTDRVGQMVIKNRLEPILEEVFHQDSYAYRPSRSALDAVTVCRERCFKYEWLLEIDIKGFFDNLNHEMLLQMLEKYTQDKAILLYVRKFLKAKGRTSGGEEIVREKGTPQGGVVSPILANLYLHESFDQWMKESFPHIQFERFADDIVVHSVSEKQAFYLKNRIEERLKIYKLELHPEKTRIVYTGISNQYDSRGHKLSRKFTFLGYDFKPRMHKGRIVFTPGIGKGALKRILVIIKKEWRLLSKVSQSLEEISREVNPMIRGWINYYGHHRKSDLRRLAYMIDTRLVKFLKRKRKSVRTWGYGWDVLNNLRIERPKLFCHWYMVSQKRGAV